MNQHFLWFILFAEFLEDVRKNMLLISHLPHEFSYALNWFILFCSFEKRYFKEVALYIIIKEKAQMGEFLFVSK